MATKRKANTIRLTDVAPHRDAGFRDFVDACSWEEDPGRYWADTMLLQELKKQLEYHDTGTPGLSASWREGSDTLDPVGALDDDVIQAAVDEIAEQYVGWKFDAPDGPPRDRLDAHFAAVIAAGVERARRNQVEVEARARRDAEHSVAVADAERRSFGLS